MPELLTNLIEYFNRLLQSYAWAEEIILGAVAVLLFIMLIVRIRRRRKKEIRKKPADLSLQEEAGEETREFSEPEPKPEPMNRQEPEAVPEPEPESRPAPEKPAGLMDRLKAGLGKTRKSMTQRIESAFSDKGTIDTDTIDEIEEALITSDIGIETTSALIGRIEKNQSKISSIDDLRTFLKTEIIQVFDRIKTPEQPTGKPHVIMVAGVNGVGKTTTIGKLAYRYRKEGKSVLVGASDTFRAAAVEQLSVWAERSGAQIVSHRENADPAAVAYDAVEAAISRNIDHVIIDTAGRLHTKTNLMEQLKKIKRSIAKKMPDAPHEILLVLDATTGQNAVSQAKMFHEGIGITGIVLTKLDGTAKGGIVVAICNTMQLPIYYIGVGEAMEDLQPFDPKRFVEALF